MLTFIYGPDTYRLRRHTEEECAKISGGVKGEVPVYRFDLYEDDVEEALSYLGTSSLFGALPVLVLQNPLCSEECKRRVHAALEHAPGSSNVLVVQPGEVRKKDELVAFLLEQADTVCACEVLPKKELPAFVDAECQRCGVSIDRNASSLLIARSGGDTWRLATEIEKMAAACDYGRINAGMVDEYTADTEEVTVFPLLDALAERKRKKALSLLHRHLERGEAPLYLLSMIAWQYRNILVVQELADTGASSGEVQRQAGLKPFVVKKSRALASRFRRSELERAYSRLLQYDVAIKRGNMDASTALELFVAHR